jgi:hypothetical protein
MSGDFIDAKVPPELDADELILLRNEAEAHFNATHDPEKVFRIKARAGVIAVTFNQKIAQKWLEAAGVRQRFGPRDARGVVHPAGENPFWHRPFAEAAE